MKKIFLALCLLIAGFLSAQTTVRGKVTTVVTNEKNTPLENATVELLKSKDSSLAKTAITDRNGVAEFDNIRAGSYFARISFVNYATTFTSFVTITADQPNIAIPTIVLQPRAAEMKEVVVSTRKPFIQRLADRLVVNVENSIVSAGSSAMDVLERSPGVSVDQNDAIGLRGKQGVTIMIDGKPTPLTGADLASYLRGLPSNAIERIDLITNPSAKYEAAGNSGIIDIRMKKDQRLGTNGTLTAGYGQGIYPKANAGGTINYRNKKVNLFGNYNYAYRMNLNHLILDRNFYTNGVYSGGDLKDNYAKRPSNFHAFRGGADFFLSKKDILGFVVTHNYGLGESNTDNNSVVLNSSKQAASTFQTKAFANSTNRNTIANINYKHSFNTAGKELTADIDYGEFKSGSLSTTATKYYALNGGALQPDYILNGDQSGKLKLRTAKIDYANPLPQGARFETGLKTSYVSSDNDAKFFDMSSGSPVDDVNKTNRFFYEEYNNAAYFNLAKEFKRFNFQVGVRAEHTRLKTHQVKGNTYFDSSYLKLFPSAFLNYKIKDDQILGISVSRRIDRPGYSQLNPFLFLIDVTTYGTGNPRLLPQFTWSYELNYTVKSINFTLAYSHTTQNQNIAIARFKDVFPTIPQADNVTVQIPINLSTSDYYGVSVSAPVRVNKRWNMINNANMYINKFNGRLGITNLNRGKPAFDYRVNNTFTLGRGWTTELNGNFSTGGQNGFMVSNPQWGIALGVQKTVMQNRGTIRFNITDIFWTDLPRATITYDNYIEKWHAYRESRVANLSFTYRFGKNTVQAARKRTTASEEERQRAGN
ncbi:TonB-dependent receptor [Sediminibacterium roseum]|uniref:TonB-dependent receptor n=1 Tax=Sediminibacterium roseum TaxID=1978412 RepID=A0ABW9ZPH1_9BACT|nr:outer membrane beta-barrel family protein [Sediminibacterium roseum]NCI48382.1 TonB-dependent receptor [Sediminibacterium roseum]